MKYACAILSSVACPGCSIFFHIISRFSKNNNVLEMRYVFRFSLQSFPKTFLITRRNKRDMIKKMYIGLHVKCRSFLPDFK